MSLGGQFQEAELEISLSHCHAGEDYFTSDGAEPVIPRAVL